MLITRNSNLLYNGSSFALHIKYIGRVVSRLSKFSIIALAIPVPLAFTVTAIEASSSDPSECGLIWPHPSISLLADIATMKRLQCRPVGLMPTV